MKKITERVRYLSEWESKAYPVASNLEEVHVLQSSMNSVLEGMQTVIEHAQRDSLLAWHYTRCVQKAILRMAANAETFLHDNGMLKEADMKWTNYLKMYQQDNTVKLLDRLIEEQLTDNHHGNFECNESNKL